MDRLAIYLPPFAGDYSGVCSALYELNCLIIIDDASCCTRNYVTYDEPRWMKSTRTTFGSNLRTIEAVLGDEERLISQTIEAARQLRPEFIALLGSPVPAIIGRDMNGIAREIENRSGIPALGFDTTGFAYYNKGVSAAHLKLLKRFTGSEAKGEEASETGHKSQTNQADHTDQANLTNRTNPKDQTNQKDHTITDQAHQMHQSLPEHTKVNILGLTPLDFSANANSGELIGLLEENGFQVSASFWVQTGLNQIRRAASAEVNFVVSQSGWAAAQYLQKNYGIPYVAAAPMGIRHSRSVLEALRQTARDKQNRISNGALAETQGVSAVRSRAWAEAPGVSPAGGGASARAGGPAVLIIGDQIMANSLRAALRQAGSSQMITVASFFDLEPELALPGDLLLKSEGQLVELLRRGVYTRLIADPLIFRIPAAAGLEALYLPHPAVSSLLYWEDVPLFIGESFERTIQNWIG